jgi:hypothetical protein
MGMNQVQKAASLLGKMSKGKKKTITAKDRRQRILRLAEARKKRWPSKNEPSQEQKNR